MKNKKIEIKCPYCGCKAVLRDASYVYGEKSLGGKLMVCAKYPKCDSYVGVHEGTDKPKGTLANGDLRNKRIHTHKIFDQIWKSGCMSKKSAYRWLQFRLCLNSTQTHIGNFSEYMCNRVIEESEKILKNNGAIGTKRGNNNETNKRTSSIGYGPPKYSEIHC